VYTLRSHTSVFQQFILKKPVYTEVLSLFGETAAGDSGDIHKVRKENPVQKPPGFSGRRTALRVFLAWNSPI